MRRAARILLLLMFAGAVLVALTLAAALVWGLPLDHVSVVIDGERIEVPPLGPGHWLVASIVMLLVLAVLAVVVPLAIAFGLVAPLVLLALALVAAAVLAAAALSPLLLFGWLVWRIARRPGNGTLNSTRPSP
jgi:hypothetical protein